MYQVIGSLLAFAAAASAPTPNLQNRIVAERMFMIGHGGIVTTHE